MKIIDEKISQQTLDKHRNELFLLNEELENIKDKRIIKLTYDNEVVAIAMYSQLDAEEIELYLNGDQKDSIGKLLCNGIYLDSIYSLVQGSKYASTIIIYLQEKFNSKAIWLYSNISGFNYWTHRKDFRYYGENIFVSNLC